jgi:4-carboxymuconolactone decarboxylase
MTTSSSGNRNPRIGPIVDMTPEVAELLAKGLTYRDSPYNAARTMARHPRLLKRFMLFTGLFLTHSRLPDRDRELLTLRSCFRSDTDYYFGHHVILARAAGLTIEDALAVADLEHPWDDHDSLLLAVADELTHDNRLTDQTWTALARLYDEDQLIEILFVVGYYRMVACYTNTLEIELEPGVPSIPRRTST